MKILSLIALYSLLLTPHAALAAAEGENIFVVRQYSYEGDGNRETGQSLCGTRCNALSDSFASYIKPGGWRLIKIAENKGTVLPLDYPFIKGHCICTGDEYRVKRYDPTCSENNP